MSLEDFKQVARTFNRSLWDQRYGFEIFVLNGQEEKHCLVVEAAYRKGWTTLCKADSDSDRGIQFVAKQYRLPERFVQEVYYSLGNYSVGYGQVEYRLDEMARMHGVEE